jgi:hypothetical protein
MGRLVETIRGVKEKPVNRHKQRRRAAFGKQRKVVIVEYVMVGRRGEVGYATGFCLSCAQLLTSKAGVN